MGLRDLLSGGAAKCSTADFDVRLRGKWQAAHEPTHYGFVNEAEGEQVTVSAQRSTRPLDKPALLLAALDLVRVRQDAYRRLSGGTTSFSEPQTTDAVGGMDVTFGVSDAAGGVQSRIWVLARPQRLVTVAFNRYPPLLDAATFEAKAAQVLSGVRVR